MSPLRSSGLPGTGTLTMEGHIRKRAASSHPQMVSSLLGLAPGGGYLAVHITADAGGPLHHLFTITPMLAHGGCFFSVALIRQVNVSRRFPRPGCYPTPCSMECGLSSTQTTPRRDCPTSLRHFYHTLLRGFRQFPASGYVSNVTYNRLSSIPCVSSNVTCGRFSMPVCCMHVWSYSSSRSLSTLETGWRQTKPSQT
jgi:hypothetical protein